MTDESVFVAAVAIPSPADRAAYLDRACAGNPGLRREVDELLAAHAASNPLDRPPADLARTGAYEPADGPPNAAVGDRVGPYRLMEQIGEGGMGEVWVADQLEPLRRRVALKLIKPGMDSRAVLARFEAERQALAVMDHPNIARVLDAGTAPDGRPFFVMELVKGTPITDFADARRLTPRERLELFIPVCQAIQHAHQKGIIHRDIKPSNVLVALHDEAPVPKVIDFGVAKAIGQQLTEKTVYTGFGALVGTPAYMAPEQATFNQLDVDTRADVYALGVLLYELLAGTPPVEPDRLRKAALDEVLRIVRDEEPPRPSQRLSTSQAKATIAATRQTDAVRLSALMRGELDWIVMKALEKDRTRRYDTPTALAKDVQRYLAGELVEARPPTLGYRLRKFARKKSTILTALIFLSMLPSLGWAVFGMLRAQDAERAAVAAREDADRQRNQAVEERVTANVERANAETARKDATTQRDELRRTNYVASIGLAAASLESGQVALARDLLERTRPKPGEPDDLRGWEWHYLRRAFNAERGSIPGPAEPVASCAYSRDGKYLAVAHGGMRGNVFTGSVRVVEVGKSGDVLDLSLGEARVRSLAFSPDGSFLAVTVSRLGPEANGAQSWSAVEVRLVALSSREVRAFRLPSSANPTTPSVSPDGRFFALFIKREIGSAVVVFDTKKGGEPVLERPLGGNWGEGDATYTADGRLLVAYMGRGRDRAVRLLEPDTDTGPGRVLYDPRPDSGSMAGVNLLHDGRWVVVVDMNRVVRGWDLVADAVRPAFTFRAERMTHSVRGFRVSPDGRLCAMVPGSFGLVAPVWDVRTGREVLAIRGHTGGIFGLEFSPDGRTVVTGSDDRTVKLWDVPAADSGRPLTAPVLIRGIAHRPDGGVVAVTMGRDADDSDEGFVIRDVPPGGTPRLLLRGPPAGTDIPGYTPVVLAPDGSRVASVNREAAGRVKLWDVVTRQPTPEFPADGLPASHAQFVTPDRLVVRHRDGSQQLYAVPSGQPIGEQLIPPGGDRNFFMPVAGNGHGFVTCRESQMLLVDLSGRVVRTATAAEGPGIPLALSPDGKTLAATLADGVVKLYDTRSGVVTQRLRGHTASVRCGAFSPDGRRLFTGSVDQTVRVWDVVTGQEVLSIRHENTVNALALSPDGHRLATQEHWNGRGTVFDATPIREPKP